MKLAVRDKKSGKYQNRIFFLLLIMAVVPLMIVGAVSYSMYMTETTKQTDLSMGAIEMQICNDVEGTLSSIRKYYLDCSSDDRVKWLMNAPGVPYSEYSNIYEGQNLLKGPTYLNENIGSYAFINIKLGWVLTNNGMYPLGEIRNLQKVRDFLDIVSNSDSTLFWHNNIEEPSPYGQGVYQSKTLDISGFLLVLKLPGSVQRMDQVLLVQLNLKELERQLNTTMTGYKLCILGGDGKTLYASDRDLEAYCSSSAEELKETAASRDVRLENGDDYRLRIRSMQGNGLTYILAYNLNDMKEGAGRILAVSVLLILVLTALVIVSWFFSSILYRPVKNLTDYVLEAAGSSTEEMIPKADEFTSILENVGHLIDTKDNLSLMVQNQQKLLVEQFLVRAVRGEMTPEAIYSAQEQFRLPRARVYCLIAAVCMLQNETEPESELENEALNLTIVKHLPDDLISLLITRPFCIGEQLLLVAGAETDAELQNKIRELHKALTGFIYNEFGCAILSGVSQYFSGLKYLRTAYNECAETLRNAGSPKHAGKADSEERQGFKGNDITFYEDIARSDGIISGYDFVIENLLTKAVNEGASEDAAQLVDKFVNSLNNREITWHDRSFFLYRLTIAVLSVLSDAGLSANQVFKERSDDIFKQLNYIYEADRLKSYLNSRIVQPAIEALRSYRFNASSDILKRIVELVKEARGDITLTECADRLNYHPGYIWKVLKAERNMTFMDLVNMEKLDAAKELLLKTDLSIAEIAERLKYSNTQNFIRFFGKVENISPGKYRKEHQNAE